jgi:ubiquinone/menaquinone biosynthesis C-methylase UbiE
LRTPLVGLDIAATGLRLAARVASDAWDFVHGNMMALPFPDRSFDAVFSFGVLALTPRPRRALEEMARVLKPGGLLGFWVFAGDAALIRGGIRALRGLARALGPGGATLVANAIVPFYGLLPTRSKLSLGRASWRQTREVLMSNLTPPFLHFLAEAELRAWLDASGISVLQESDGERITLWGQKR